MKKYLAAVAGVAIAASLAACGGTQHTKTVKVAATPSITVDPTTGCAMRDGQQVDPTCGTASTPDPTTDTTTDPSTTDSGGSDTSTTDTTAPTTTVGRGGTLKLDSLSAKIAGVRIEHQLSSDMGVKTAKGKFVIVSLTVTNKAHSPQSFDNGQSALIAANGDNYSEDFDVENGVDQHSLLWTSGGISGDLQPGQTVTGDVVFDVPSNVRVSGGSLAVVNFGDDTTYPDQASQIGEVALGNLD